MENKHGQEKLIITQDYKDALKPILLETYFAGWDPDYLASECFQSDLEDILWRRMIDVESNMIPWVSDVCDIDGMSIVEIGCGTGTATIPFALRSAVIHSYGITESSLRAAAQRATLLGVGGTHFHILDRHWAQSAQGLESIAWGKEDVDIVLLYAVLEHLTIQERINVLQRLWQCLKPGGIIIVYETPNRIWYFDWHSFILPFFNSLPDELALLYWMKSPRKSLKVESDGDSKEHLYRLGRGVSYHEFELALNFDDLTVINDGYSHRLRHRENLSHPAFEKAILEIFEEHLPHIPLAFARPSLDLVIRKER